MGVGRNAEAVGNLCQDGLADVGVAWAAGFRAESVCVPRVGVIMGTKRRSLETLVSRSKMVQWSTN